MGFSRSEFDEATRAGRLLDEAGVPRLASDCREFSSAERIELLVASRDDWKRHATRLSYWLGVAFGISIAGIVLAGGFTYWGVISKG